MKILCHVGPWCVEQYKSIARSVCDSADITLISGFRDIDETTFQKNYYKYVAGASVNMDGLDEDDFILRCRLLRSLPIEEARLHLYATRASIAEVLDNLMPDMVISEVVDQFLIDVLRHECDTRGIPFYGLVVSFVNGYYRVTARGEKSLARRSVDEAEVNKVLEKLDNKNYSPAFVKATKHKTGRILDLWTTLYRSNLKIPYFYVKRHLSGEKYNYHYWASYVSALDSFHLIPRFYLGQRLSQIKREISKISKPVIYIPLQMYPEATVEYWSKNIEVINYNKVLPELVEKLSRDFHIVLKEHPNVIGTRHPRLYKKLLCLPGVFFCETSANSNEIVNLSDSVLVWTGSVGFEAALRGKPVLTMTNAYYVDGERFKLLDMHTENSEIRKFIVDACEKPTNNQKLVASLLEGLEKGRYKNDFSWSAIDENDISDSKAIGRAIANMYAKSEQVL